MTESDTIKEKTQKKYVSRTPSALINNDSEKLKPLFIPCYLFIIGIIVLSGVHLIDPALLESANWKQNTIWSLLILFGLMPPGMRNRKEIWMVMGYTAAFFMFGGSNIYSTVNIILLAIKTFTPVLILYQACRLWKIRKFDRKWLFLLPIAALTCVILIFPIENKNLIDSGWQSLRNWSWENYRSDDYFHLYLGLIGIISGITEFLIVKPYLHK